MFVLFELFLSSVQNITGIKSVLLMQETSCIAQLSRFVSARSTATSAKILFTLKAWFMYVVDYNTLRYDL